MKSSIQKSSIETTYADEIKKIYLIIIKKITNTMKLINLEY
jgi:hypothetical protein